MRRLVTIAILLMSSLVAYAQMMPDSTVQVCAYWEKGDVMEYECTRTSETVNPDGTSMKKTSASEIRVFEVVDETEHSYTLKTTYRDVFSSDVNLALGPAADVYSNLAERIEVYTLTDEFGSVQDVINVDETMNVNFLSF